MIAAELANKDIPKIFSLGLTICCGWDNSVLVLGIFEGKLLSSEKSKHCCRNYSEVIGSNNGLRPKTCESSVSLRRDIYEIYISVRAV